MKFINIITLSVLSLWSTASFAQVQCPENSFKKKDFQRKDIHVGIYDPDTEYLPVMHECNKVEGEKNLLSCGDVLFVGSMRDWIGPFFEKNPYPWPELYTNSWGGLTVRAKSGQDIPFDLWKWDASSGLGSETRVFCIDKSPKDPKFLAGLTYHKYSSRKRLTPASVMYGLQMSNICTKNQVKGDKYFTKTSVMKIFESRTGATNKQVWVHTAWRKGAICEKPDIF